MASVGASSRRTSCLQKSMPMELPETPTRKRLNKDILSPRLQISGRVAAKENKIPSRVTNDRNCKRSPHATDDFTALRSPISTPRKSESSLSPLKLASSPDCVLSSPDRYSDPPPSPPTSPDVVPETPKRKRHSNRVLSPFKTLFTQLTPPKCSRSNARSLFPSSPYSTRGKKTPTKGTNLNETKSHTISPQSSSSNVDNHVTPSKTSITQALYYRSPHVPKMNASSFYKGGSIPQLVNDIGTIDNNTLSDRSRNMRSSLPVEIDKRSHINPDSQRLSIRRLSATGRKRRTFDGINFGVRHGIKKPNYKRSQKKPEKTAAKPVMSTLCSNAKNLEYKRPSTRRNSLLDQKLKKIPGNKVKPIVGCSGPVSHPLLANSPGSPFSPSSENTRKILKHKKEVLPSSRTATVSMGKGIDIKLEYKHGAVAFCKRKSPRKLPAKRRRLSGQARCSVNSSSTEVSKKILPSVQSEMFDTSQTDSVDSEEQNLHNSVKTIIDTLEDNLSSTTQSSSVEIVTSDKVVVMGEEKSQKQSVISFIRDVLQGQKSTDMSSAGKVELHSHVSAQEQEGTSVTGRKNPQLESENERPDGNKLFPLFYKKHAVSPSTVTKTLSKINLKDVIPCTTKKVKYHGWKDSGTDGKEQLVIDAGQKEFGATQCPTCKVVYTIGDPEDEYSHASFHDRFLTKLNFVGWKKERVVAEHLDGHIIMILPDDPRYCWAKVNMVREIVDNDLGFSEVGIRNPANSKVFLYISDKKVVGCLIAERVSYGYRVIEVNKADTSSQESLDNKPYCCSNNAEKIHCGISRIWTMVDYRRKKIASRLVDCFRTNFVYGSYLGLGDFAFSDPTVNGMVFAEKYTGTKSFLVYNR